MKCKVYVHRCISRVRLYLMVVRKNSACLLFKLLDLFACIKSGTLLLVLNFALSMALTVLLMLHHILDLLDVLILHACISSNLTKLLVMHWRKGDLRIKFSS